MMSLLCSVFLGKATDGVPTDHCKEATPSSITSTKTFAAEEFPASTPSPPSLVNQVSLCSTPPSQNNSSLLTDPNKTLHKLPLKDFEKVLTPPSYEDQPSLWPILEPGFSTLPRGEPRGLVHILHDDSSRRQGRQGNSRRESSTSRWTGRRLRWTCWGWRSTKTTSPTTPFSVNSGRSKTVSREVDSAFSSSSRLKLEASPSHGSALTP